jgi:hypothetical protein
LRTGAATTVTDCDMWMFKRTWSEPLRMNRWPWSLYIRSPKLGTLAPTGIAPELR